MDSSAVIAVVVSILALSVSFYFGWCARDHNRRSVKPLPYVAPNNYENHISVRLWNYGSGPLVLLDATARHGATLKIGHLIDLAPQPPDGFLFDDFVRVTQGRAIPPGESIDLLAITITDDVPCDVSYRRQLREFLGGVTMRVSYQDIYESTFPVYERELDSFRADVCGGVTAFSEFGDIEDAMRKLLDERGQLLGNAPK